MISILIAAQAVMLLVQMYCVFCYVKHDRIILANFGLWGSMPNIIIMLVVIGLTI